MSASGPRHPEQELLLAYLDGELRPTHARRIERHLKACWECRAEADELRQTIGDCVRYRRDVLHHLMPAPPREWPDLTREFARIDESIAHSPRLARLSVRWMALAAAAVSLVAAGLTLRVGLFRNSTAPPNKKEVTRLPNPPASTGTRKDGPLPPSVRVPGQMPSEEQFHTAGPADELRVLAALHQLGADLGEPVEVKREGANVVVGGVGVSPDLRRQIRESISSIPHVVIRFAELPDSGPAAQAAPRLEEPVQPASQSSAPNQLEALLGGRQELENFSSQLLDRNESAMARVYALRRLAQEFPPDAERELKPEERKLLHAVATEHVQHLEAELKALVGELAPILRNLGGSSPNPAAQAPKGSWQDCVESIFPAARQTDTLTAALLGAAGSDLPVQNLAVQLESALERLQANVQQCELLLGR